MKLKELKSALNNFDDNIDIKFYLWEENMKKLFDVDYVEDIFKEDEEEGLVIAVKLIEFPFGNCIE
jgi:hypothetical protein